MKTQMAFFLATKDDSCVAPVMQLRPAKYK